MADPAMRSLCAQRIDQTLQDQKGSFVEGKAQKNDRFANPKVRFVETIDAKSGCEKRDVRLQQLTTVAPNEQLHQKVKTVG